MRLICAQSVSIKGTEYVEVRCNAGYVLSGRNLGIQELGTLAIGATFSQLDCQHRWGECGGWPEDSDYTACSTTSTGNDRCTVAQCIPGDGQYRKAESPLPTSISSLCVHPLPSRHFIAERMHLHGARGVEFYSRSHATCCMKGSRSIRLSALLKICPCAGSWKIEERTCTAISCGAYPEVQNGAASPSGNIGYNERVTITW
jgi:hypothetical protein